MPFLYIDWKVFMEFLSALGITLPTLPVTKLDWVVAVMPWFMSVITVWMTWMTGHKHPATWVVGLGNQVLWTTWIVLSGTWSLVPVNLTLWVLYYRNHRLWKRDIVTNQSQLPFINTYSPHIKELP